MIKKLCPHGLEFNKSVQVDKTFLSDTDLSVSWSTESDGGGHTIVWIVRRKNDMKNISALCFA